jgi:hypothetical protein
MAKSAASSADVAEVSRWAWSVDTALRRRVQEHAAALGQERERAAAAEAQALAWKAQVDMLQRRVEEMGRLAAHEQLRADTALGELAALEGLVRASLQPQMEPVPCVISSSFSSSSLLSLSATTTAAASSRSSSSSYVSDSEGDGFLEEEEEEELSTQEAGELLALAQKYRRQALEAQDRKALMEVVLSVYSRVVHCNQDALLLLHRSGSAALDDGSGQNVGPVVAFANVTAATVLGTAPAQLLHGCVMGSDRIGSDRPVCLPGVLAGWLVGRSIDWVAWVVRR